MTKKITYLLGAGASANTIPVVANMTQRISEIIEKLKQYRNITTNITDQRQILLLPNTKQLQGQMLVNHYETNLGKIIAYLEILKEQAGKHYTIDTLAKKYFLKGNHNELQELKRSLITYFTLEQFLFIASITDQKKGYSFEKNELDKRYDSFIASIAKRENGELILNGNINVLSWNYDSQFELTLKNYVDSNNLNYLKEYFNIHPNSHDKPKVKGENYFGLIKINGTAIVEETPNGPFVPKTIFDFPIPNRMINVGTSDEINFLKRLGIYVDNYPDAFLTSQVKKDPVEFFNFAWEHENSNENLEKAEKIASKTEILVVIGYSFPIFNREIDNKLFSKMKKLKKVYIQDKEPDNIKLTMENAFEIFQRTIPLANRGAVDDVPVINFHLQKNTNQFVIPYELNQG